MEEKLHRRWVKIGGKKGSIFNGNLQKAFCPDMKEIYTAANEEAGLAALDRFENKWGNKYSYG